MSWISASLMRASASTCNDIDILPAPEHRKAFQFQLTVGGAFAGFQIVFVAMPRADEMNFISRKLLPAPGPVGSNHILDLVHHHAFAGRSALMHAQVLIGVEFPLPMEHADFARPVTHDAAFAIEIGRASCR